MKKIALTLCAVFGLSLAASVFACDANGGHDKTHNPAPSAPATPAPTK